MIAIDESNTKYLRWIVVLLGFISAFLFVYIIITLKTILVPFIVAIFLTFLFDPIIRFLCKFKIPVIISIMVVVFIVIGGVFFINFLIVFNIGSLTFNIPFYLERLINFIQKIFSPLHLTATEIAGYLGLTQNSLHSFEEFQKIFNLNTMMNSISFITNAIKDFLFIVVFWIFMSAGKLKFEDRFREAYPQDSNIYRTVETITEQIRSYIFFKSLVNMATAIIATIIFLVFGVPYALLWGVLMFFLYYIPHIGSIAAMLPPLILIFIENGTSPKSISFAAILICLQFTIGNFIEPKYIGKQMNLSPVYILISLVFWGWVWGIVGMFLAVPIASTLKILCANISALRPISILMGSGNKPAKSNPLVL